MAIHPKCDRCGKTLSDYGAILLSPPDKKSKVTKYHICKMCYKDIIKNNKITIKNSYQK